MNLELIEYPDIFLRRIAKEMDNFSGFGDLQAQSLHEFSFSCFCCFYW
jgi:hypothetical protein